MLIRKPNYYDSFRCIAGNCPDSCCKEWTVQVDDITADMYQTLPGDLGDRLRQVMEIEDGEWVLTNEDGRCPMWRDDGLCRIQAECGESALCQTCRQFPRLTHDYGDFQELGLELSCPEVARIILQTDSPSFVTEETAGGDSVDYDVDAMSVLLRTREQLHVILSDTSRPVNEVLALTLLYGYHAQAELDGAPEAPFDPESALSSAKAFAVPADISLFLDFFKSLDVLTPDWMDMLSSPGLGDWCSEYRLLARYFADRYWLQAVSDYDLTGRVKLILISCLAIRMLGGDILRTAQLYSKEIENNIDNVEAILDAAYGNQAFVDNRLLGMLLL